MKCEEESAGYSSGVGMSAHETRHEMDYRNVFLKLECFDVQGNLYLAPALPHMTVICDLTQKLGVQSLH